MVKYCSSQFPRTNTLIHYPENILVMKQILTFIIFGSHQHVTFLVTWVIDSVTAGLAWMGLFTNNTCLRYSSKSMPVYSPSASWLARWDSATSFLWAPGCDRSVGITKTGRSWPTDNFLRPLRSEYPHPLSQSLCPMRQPSPLTCWRIWDKYWWPPPPGRQLKASLRTTCLVDPPAANWSLRTNLKISHSDQPYLSRSLLAYTRPAWVLCQPCWTNRKPP